MNHPLRRSKLIRYFILRGRVRSLPLCLEEPVLFNTAHPSLSRSGYLSGLIFKHNHGAYALTPRQHPETIVDFFEPDAARNQFVQFQAADQVLVNEPGKSRIGRAFP